MKVCNSFGSCEYEFKPDYVHIFNLFVKPEFRLLGKSRQLLQIALKEIRETGHKKDILIVTDSKKLKIFYESLGLKVYKYYLKTEGTHITKFDIEKLKKKRKRYKKIYPSTSSIKEHHIEPIMFAFTHKERLYKYTIHTDNEEEIKQIEKWWVDESGLGEIIDEVRVSSPYHGGIRDLVIWFERGL